MKSFVSLALLFAVSLQAAPMSRVVRVTGPATIVVDRGGVQSEVRLSGIEILDPQNAFRYLDWTIGSSWVMVENGLVYRSPDALLVNDDLVRRGFARSTAAPLFRTPATYLGDLNPEPAAANAKPPARRATAAPQSRARPVRRARPARAQRRK